ncbi:MAG: TonB-dependent receptor, partial [Thermoanaerobaculia bacterium]
EGGALPGVAVEATSPSLQGTRTAVTDEGGEYRLTLLPPGDYAVKATLEGFAEETREAVPVQLARDTTLNLALRAAASEVITVVAEAAVVDPTTTTLGYNLDDLAIETLPAARNYASLAQVVPGTSSDAHPENTGQQLISVYGSTGAENVYLIDGVNTTNLEFGFQGKELNFEFIEAIDVKTGGYEAEFGRSTGGIINVITKSGGNEFHGDVFAYYDDDSLQSSPDDIVSTAGTVEGFTREDFGADLGGYILEDRLWFFAAYDVVANDTDSRLPAGPQAGAIVTSESDRDLAAAKLTWNVASSQSLVGSFFQDPRDDSGAIVDPKIDHVLNGEPATYLGVQELGGDDIAVGYQGAFGSRWLVTGQVARHTEENSVGPASAAGDEIQYRDVQNDLFATGGFGLIQSKDFERESWGGTASRFFADHELKFGLDFEDQTAEVTKRMSGGQRVDVFANPVDPDRPIYRHFYWTTPDATVDNAPVSALFASPEHQNTAVFVQDRWQVTDRLTLNLGVRWDRQEIIDAAGTKQIDLDEDYAPRLGFVWDPQGDQASKLFGSYGRYYEQIPMDLVIRSFSFERQPRIINYDPVSTVPDPQAEADLGTESGILGGFTEPSDPNLENQYISEFLLGYEREIFPDVAVGAKLIYREYGQVVEDFLCADDGTYCIGNPGEGIMQEIFTLDYSRTLPAPDPEREYRGVQLDVSKRFSDRWQGIASYVYSKLEGNFDGLFAPFTNIGADPNITAAYDYFDFFTDGRDFTRITNDGPLSNDRRHQFKVSGFYLTDFDLSIGLAAYYRTGTPLTRYGFSDAYNRYEFFLTERGAEGRTPTVFDADLHLGYPIAVGRTEINLLLDIFSIFNTQRPLLLDQRYGFQEADNFSPVPVNQNFHEAVLRTPPTTAR